MKVGNLEAWRDFSDVRDIIRAYWLSTEKCQFGEPYNIGSGKTHQIKEVLDVGKKPIDEYQLGQFRFDADDQLKYVESIILKDPTTANLILSNKVFSLIELFFDIRLLWTPAPKQRLAKITELDAKLFELLEQFYKEPITLPEKLTIAREIVPLVFRK